MNVEAVFLDRDGTLIENRHYLASPAGVALLPGVREAVALLRGRGVKLFLFTNQSGVGRGYFTLADVEAVNRRMIELLGLGTDLFTDVCIAPERPDETNGYRKPSPRFITETLAAFGIAHQAAWMVGDSPVDWQAGMAAGVRVAAIVGADVAGHEADVPGVTSVSSLLDWVQSLESGSSSRGHDITARTSTG